ncbi:hypothetical protein HF863_04930 [Lactobacillus agilis]|uniref:Uncharacterized protein n=1 Tax=Ligilactobacillus agilis TaxID=1601 RepID=A0A848C958_9LACO|nr:hypothetical protein [Ligilactobacillus agilis]NME42109.1 hypothetical protein [Ligilactobacillus agilis]
MKKNKTITALCVSLLALSSSNSLVYAATTEASSASSQTKVATSSQATNLFPSYQLFFNFSY